MILHALYDQRRLPYQQAKLLARQSPAARQAFARAARAAFRPAWAQHFRRQRAILADLAEERRSAQRLATSLAREGNAAGALATLNRFQRRHTHVLHTLTSQRAALGRAQYAALRARVRQTDPARQPSAGHARLPVRRLAAANDNSARQRSAFSRARTRSGSRFRLLLTYSPAPPVHSIRLLRATHRSERQLLLAMQAAASAALTRHGGLARNAGSLARSEIALAFASRWAGIERMPASLRAAARAALKAEQVAALSARLSYHSGRLRAEQRSARLALSREHLQARRALTHCDKLAWTAAADGLRQARPGRAPSLPSPVILAGTESAPASPP